jgi:hypothetical protein
MRHARFKRLLSVLTVVGLIASASSARGDFIVNGNFSSGSDGLSGWTVSDPGFVTVTAGQATIREDQFGNEVDLYQIFKLPSPSTTSSISFRLVSVTSDIIGNNDKPSAFNVALLDPLTGNALAGVNTVNNSDSFYTGDLNQGITNVQTAKGVSVDSGTGVITIDTSGLSGNANGEVELLFRVITAIPANPQDPNFVYNASVTIDSVQGTTGSGGGGTSAVPAPPSVVLLGVGILFLAGHVWWSRRKFLTAACGKVA